MKFYRHLSSSRNFNDILKLLDKFEASKCSPQSSQATNTDNRLHEESFIRIIGNGNSGSPKSFLLHTNGQKFLVNCAESTSRILMEASEIDKMKELDIVLTRSTWNNCFSGIFGMIYSLTNSQNKTSNIRFHASFDVPNFLYSTYHLLKLKSIHFELHDYKKLGPFSSKNIQLQHLPLSSVYAYLFTFNLKGMNKMLVLDIPDKNELNHVVLNNSSLVKDHIDLFVHLSPNEITNERKYIDFVKQISDRRTRHLVFDETRPNLVSEKIYLQQIFLNQLDTFIFPQLPYSPQTEKPKGIFGYNQVDAKTSAIINLTSNSLSETLHKWDQVDLNNVDKDYPNLKKQLSIYAPTQATYKRELDYPQLVFLGTSSTYPTAIRNVSSILLMLSPDQSILMDCGEGTLGQLIKFFGQYNYERQLVKVKAVFLSHFHADHHTGVFEIINARKKSFDLQGVSYEKLFVCLPDNLRSFFASINRFSDIIPFSDLVNLIDNADLLVERGSFKIKSELNKAIGVKNIETVPVKHVLNSMGLILTTSKHKLVYSGDCVPSEEIIFHGRNCDLLIHEATFADSKAALAENLMHSTVSQAIEVGNRMKAKNIVLTHFSASLSSNADELYTSPANNVTIASDFMRINLALTSRIKLLKPGLKLLNPNSMNSIRAGLFK